MFGSSNSREPYFKVYEKNGKFYFQLIAANGEPLASSEPYSSRQAAHNGCDAVKRAASDADVRDE